MKDAIKSIMKKENVIMGYANLNNLGSEQKFEKLINGFTDKEIIVLECLMHAGREEFTKQGLPEFNSVEELIDIFYNEIIIKEQKEFNRNIAISGIVDKFLRLHDYLKCAFQIINDPYISRNLVEI